MNLERSLKVVPVTEAETEIDLRQIVQVIWRGKWLIGSVVGAMCVLAVFVALNLPNKYKAVEILTPPPENEHAGGIMGAIGSSLGNLASLAGVTLPGAGTNSEAMLATLQSDKLIIGFINDNNLKPLLFPGNWDEEQHRWKPNPPPGYLHSLMQSITNDPVQIAKSKAPTMEPTDFEAATLFKKRVLEVTLDRKSELVTLTITWTDPTIAASWAHLLVKRLNEQVRVNMIADADRSIAYLQDALRHTQEVEVQQAIYGLMETKLKSRMMASVNDEVAFIVVDPAVAPTVPSSPSRKAILAGSFLLALVLSVSFLLVREQWAASED